MTLNERLNDLKTHAGSACDFAQVELCDLALNGNAEAITTCLDVCRQAEAERFDFDAWMQIAAPGDYLAEYWEGEIDLGSRCGWSDSGLDHLRRKLAPRRLTLRTDDRGIRVEAV
jgi:hypothetical protein